MGSAGEKTFQIRAGEPCLDFANTFNWENEGMEVERLDTYADLLGFARQSGVLSDADVRRLSRLAAEDPAGAQRTLARARRIRDAVLHVFLAVADDKRPPKDHVATLNQALADAMQNVRLQPSEEVCCRWTWGGEPDALDRMLWPLVRGAADLLTDESRLHMLGKCVNDNCGWLFLDTSKNHSRRWCSMADCGNRDKVRRHYRKHRSDD